MLCAITSTKNAVLVKFSLQPANCYLLCNQVMPRKITGVNFAVIRTETGQISRATEEGRNWLFPCFCISFEDNFSASFFEPWSCNFIIRFRGGRNNRGWKHSRGRENDAANRPNKFQKVGASWRGGTYDPSFARASVIQRNFNFVPVWPLPVFIICYQLSCAEPRTLIYVIY